MSYLTPDQICDKFQIPKSTLYKLTRTNRIPFIKVGGSLRFDFIEVDKWFKRKSVPNPISLN